MCLLQLCFPSEFSHHLIISTIVSPYIDTNAMDRRPSVAGSSDGSLCFSDNGRHSWHSPLESTAGGLHDDGDSDPGTNSLSDVDLENGNLEVQVRGVDRVDKDCRICHLSLVSSNQESGVAIELGCSCKDDLAAAHKKCAETWFKIRGNTTCEICGATALNVTCDQTNEANNVIVDSSFPASPMISAEIPRYWHARRIMNFLLVCMLIAFAISWLFHYNVLS